MIRDHQTVSHFTEHGGDLGAARQAFPTAPKPWLDLSTGINRCPYPIPRLDATAWTDLPGPEALRDLEAAAAAAYGARPGELVAAPGTQALIQRLPDLRPAPCRVGVLGFTYREHARAWRAAGSVVETVDDLEALQRFDVGIVVNPNNPDGRLAAPRALAAVAQHLDLLVVDEAFMDVLPAACSVASRLPAKAIVLRSFGKTYGLAGLRLGFAVAAENDAVALRRALGPWPVSGPAIAIGRAALADDGWRDATARRLAAAAGRLDRLLTTEGARILGGTPLFRLADVGNADRWFLHLARAGILVRPFAERPSWLRFGLPGDETEWDRLDAATRMLGSS